MLIRKLTYAGGTEKEYIRFAEDMGAQDGNVPWPLPNMQPVPSERYWHWAAGYSPVAVAYGGYKVWEGKGGTLYVHHIDSMDLMKGGFAILISNYGREVLYFTWSACDHAWNSFSKGNCWTGYRCTKCGAEYDIDSSG